MKMHFTNFFGYLVLFSFSSLSGMRRQELEAEASADLTRSSFFAVHEIQASDALHQFGISSFPPDQWHLLSEEDVQNLCQAVEKKNKGKSTSKKLDLLTTVALDLQRAQPTHNERALLGPVVKKFLEKCFSDSELTEFKKSDFRRIQDTESLPILSAFFNVLKEQNEKAELSIQGRGYILDLQKQIKRDGKKDVVHVTKKPSQRPSKETSSISSPQEILILEASVSAPGSSPTTPSILDQLPSFDPKDTLLIDENIQRAIREDRVYSDELEALNQEIYAIKQSQSATELVLVQPELRTLPDQDSIASHVVVSTLLRILKNQSEELVNLELEKEGFEGGKQEAQKRILEWFEELSKRNEDRAEVGAKLVEEEENIKKKIALADGFIARASKKKEEELEKLRILQNMREKVEEAQERLKPGLRAAEEFKQKSHD